MASDVHQDFLLQAFRAISADGDAITPRRVMALHLALCNTAESMRVAGRPIERLVAHVKSMAGSAGIRESHDRIVADAVLWAIAYYYGEDNVELITSPAQYCRQRRESGERAVPIAVDPEGMATARARAMVRSAERLEEFRS